MDEEVKKNVNIVEDTSENTAKDRDEYNGLKISSSTVHVATPNHKKDESYKDEYNDIYGAIARGRYYLRMFLYGVVGFVLGMVIGKSIIAGILGFVLVIACRMLLFRLIFSIIRRININK